MRIVQWNSTSVDTDGACGLFGTCRKDFRWYDVLFVWTCDFIHLTYLLILTLVPFFSFLSTYFISRFAERFTLHLEAIAHAASWAGSLQRTLSACSVDIPHQESLFHSRRGISSAFACRISTRLCIRRLRNKTFWGAVQSRIPLLNTVGVNWHNVRQYLYIGRRVLKFYFNI